MTIESNNIKIENVEKLKYNLLKTMLRYHFRNSAKIMILYYETLQGNRVNMLGLVVSNTTRNGIGIVWISWNWYPGWNPHLILLGYRNRN